MSDPGAMKKGEGMRQAGVGVGGVLAAQNGFIMKKHRGNLK